LRADNESKFQIVQQKRSGRRDSGVALNPDGEVLSDLSMLKVAQPTSSVSKIAEDPNNLELLLRDYGDGGKAGGNPEDDTDDATTPEEAENPMVGLSL